MLTCKLETHEEDRNKKTGTSRLDVLVQKYENPIKATVHLMLEEMVESAFQEFMGNRIGELVSRDKDGIAVIDYRNGYRQVKQAVVDTLILSDFQVPRNRAGGFKPMILERGRRKAGAFARMAKELFVNGLSTRKVRRAFESAGMKISGLSRSTVSSILEELQQEYLQWINRPITGAFEYLQADGVYLMKRKGSSIKAGTTIIIGIRSTGEKEVLHFTMGNESERNFDEILQRLISRGFDTKSVKLVTLDGAKGPIASITQHFGGDKLQRCVIHKTRNVIEKTPLALRDELKAKLGRLWNQPSLLDAQEFLKKIKEEYSSKAQKAIDCLMEDEDSLLRFYNFTESHRKTIRNTNLIERVIRETRRRTKVIDRIDNEFTCYRILMGAVREQNVRWAHKSHWRK
jgi:putative transposase